MASRSVQPPDRDSDQRRSAPGSNTKYRSWAIIIGTNVLALACLVWVLSGADLPRIFGEIRHLRWRWVAFAILADVCVYLLHAWRWRLLLRPIERVPFAYCFEAIYVGLFANEVLPLRAGELIRCFLLSRETRIPISVTFASALIERIFDGIWLMACFFVSMHFGHLPRVLVNGGYALGVMIVVAATIIGFAMYTRQQSLDAFLKWSWPAWFNTLIQDLHLVGHSRYLYYSFLVSGAYLLAQILPIYLLIQGTTLNLTWTVSFTLMVLLRLSSIVPQAPGNLGSFQWVVARTLMIFGVVSGHAKRFSLILWAVVTLPLIVIGCIALAVTGVNMMHLHRDATVAAQAGKMEVE